jgi:uncharacterized protein (TIGR02145 family)
MKNSNKFLFVFTLAIFLTHTLCIAQSPNKMSYQAVIRDNSNALVTNQIVGMQISILQGSASGTAVYAETQIPTTNTNGLVSIEIGGGTVVSGNFSTINWANGPYFIKTETDPAGGTNYTITGTSQLLSVPYALFSANGFPSGGANGQVLTMCNGIPTWTTGGQCPSPAGSITALNCGSATNNGTLTSGVTASGVSSLIPYTGGNGGTHNGQTVTSTGVTGLTATLAAGTFANGAGSLTYTISGTPSASGTASFSLNIGGQSCNLNLTVNNAGGSGTYPPNSVFCSGTPTVIVDVTNPATGSIWMDRNLGATQVATSSTDTNSYGDLYQWGRRSDGHQCRTSPTTSTLSSIDQPAHGSFIVPQNSPTDWRSPQNANLWQGVNGINNPCPSGYRLPTEAELNAERLSWSSNNAAGAFDTPLKFPMAGFRHPYDGLLAQVGAHGYYWCSAVSGFSSRFLDFFNGTADMNDVGRGHGFSVRCIKD